jgi:hypothetical protein
MIRKGLQTALLTMLTMGAGTAAAQFMAADLIYLPAATHTPGEGESRWRSDIYITNVEAEVAIDVALVYLPTGLSDNSARFADRSTWLGGRAADGFGFVDPALARIPPGGTVVLEDPIGEYFDADGEIANSGAIVVFAYEAGTLEDDGTRVFKNAIVNSRVYTPMTFYLPDPDNDGEFTEERGTFGQTLPGVAWYNLADPSAISEEGDFSFLILTGAVESRDFRYNVGILNASDPLSTITVVIQPFQGDGEPFLNENDNEILQAVIMPPLAHIQYNNVMSTLFGIEDVPPDVTIDVTVAAWASGSADPIIGMTTYGNMIDDRTNDPTAILPLFASSYNIACQWPSNDNKNGDTSAGGSRVSRRPVEIPAR